MIPPTDGDNGSNVNDDNDSNVNGDNGSSVDDGHGCLKCGHAETEVDSIATSGTGLSKMFDIQNRNFTVVSCTNCGYSELYRGQSKGDMIDLFLG